MITGFEAGTGVYTDITRGGNGNLQTGSAGVHFVYRFNASKSNSIYQDNCNTVQPPALSLIAQIKIQGGDIPAILSAGLPNIQGQGGSVVANSVNGAFYYGKSNPSLGSGSYSLKDLHFDASRSNLIYGASDTVQPPALILLPQIKF